MGKLPFMVSRIWTAGDPRIADRQRPQAQRQQWPTSPPSIVGHDW